MGETEVLAFLGASEQVAAGSSSARVALPAATRGFRVTATGPLAFKLGDGTVAATTTDHYLGAGDTIEFRAGNATHVAAIRTGATDSVLRISALLSTDDAAGAGQIG